MAAAASALAQSGLSPHSYTTRVSTVLVFSSFSLEQQPRRSLLGGTLNDGVTITHDLRPKERDGRS